MPSSPHLPARSGSSRRSTVPSKIERSQRRAELDISAAAVDVWKSVELDAMQSRAIGEASAVALRVEFAFYDAFREHAGSSAVKQELLARRLADLSTLNSHHLHNRFG